MEGNIEKGLENKCLQALLEGHGACERVLGLYELDMDRQTFYDHIKDKYRAEPEYPWKRYPGNADFRHSDNRKWLAFVMTVEMDKLGLHSPDPIDMVNLKVDDRYDHTGRRGHASLPHE